MQEFSTDLKSISMQIKITKGNSWPLWKLNQQYIVDSEEEFEYTKTLIISFPITNNLIELKNIGKRNNETIINNGIIERTQTLSIEKCWANNILLELQVIRDAGLFYPIYSKDNIEYAKKHSIEMPNIVKTLDFHYNGVWKFDVKRPFFIWYNDKLLQNLNNVNHWAQQSHLGIVGDSHRNRLKTILNKLSV